MKRIIIVFGLIAGLIVSGLMVISISFTKDSGMTGYGEVLGYAGMVIALSTVFFGIRSYRDNELGGTITFGKAFLVGLGITLVAGLLYMVTWEIYYQTSFSDFSDTYVQEAAEKLKATGKTDAEIEQELASTRTMMELYSGNTLFRLAVTLAEILPVGLVMSLVSAFALRRN